MKRLFFPALLLGLAACLCPSCETPIKFKGEVSDPMLVLNALITADDSVQVSLVESLFFLDESYEYPAVKDASVCLWVNGQLTDTLQHMGEGQYSCAARLAAGDEIRLTAESPKFAQVEATDHMPAAVPCTLAIENFVVDSTYGTAGSGYTVIYVDTHFQLKITFQDPPETANFYRLTLLKRNFWNETDSWQQYVYYDLSEDPNNSLLNADYAFNSFEDALLNGKRVEIVIPFTESAAYVITSDTEESEDTEPITEQSEYIVELHSLSEAYYRYLSSRSLSSDFDGIFSEPVQVYTNISGGLGILGCENIHRETIRLQPAE